EPGSAKMHYNLALALDRSGDRAGERDALEKSIQLDPKLALPQNQLGLLDPQYAEAQNNLGVLYGQRGDNRAAEALFRQAVEDNPKYTQAFVNLALIL